MAELRQYSPIYRPSKPIQPLSCSHPKGVHQIHLLGDGESELYFCSISTTASDSQQHGGSLRPHVGEKEVNSYASGPYNGGVKV